jgi:hypothetical protein
MKPSTKRPPSCSVSPDLLLGLVAYSDSNGIHLKLVATGETRTLPQTEGLAASSWSPEGAKLIAGASGFEVPGNP